MALVSAQKSVERSRLINGRVRAWKVQPARILTTSCLVCGKAVVWERGEGQRGRLRRFCSDACKLARRIARGPRRKQSIACATCGRMFRPRNGRKRPQLVCSLSCRPQVVAPKHKIYESKAERDRHSGIIRRARKRATTVEWFRHGTIFRRDRYVCGLCGQPTVKDDPLLKPSLDHVVPIAAGGTHTRDNVQCSHWICNQRKSWKGYGKARA